MKRFVVSLIAIITLASSDYAHLTGVISQELTGKRFEIFKEALPNA